MAKITFDKELQQVSPIINEENVIDDKIFELVNEDEIDLLFRLYDKYKNKITPGKIIRNGEDNITILNEAEYKTHAYLVAGSKNYLTGDSMMYSIDEVNALVTQLDTLKSRILELNAQIGGLSSIIQSFETIITNINKTITDTMMSNNNIDIYSQAFIDFYISLNRFTIDNLNNIINSLQIEKNEFSLKNFPPNTNIIQHHQQTTL